MDKLFCSDCGQSCPPAARFCHACGAALLQPDSPPPLASPPAASWVWGVYSLLNVHAGARAEPLVRERLARHPDEAAAHALLASSLLEQYQVSEAGAALDDARRLDAADYFVQREYACYLARMGRFGEAAAEARRAMQTAPSREAFEATKELWHTFAQRSQGNFVRQPPLPSVQWLFRLWNHLTHA